MSSAGPRAKLWLNQRPQRGCVFTQIWFLPSNSPFSASPGQENHQNCEKIITNLIPKQNSAWKVQISRGESCSKRLPRHMRKNDDRGSNSVESQYSLDSYFRKTNDEQRAFSSSLRQSRDATSGTKHFQRLSNNLFPFTVWYLAVLSLNCLVT